MPRRLMPLLLALLALLVVAAPAVARVQAGPTYASERHETWAILESNIGADEPLTYRFEYGPTPELGRSTPETSAGPGVFNARQRVDGLSPNTRYFARVVLTAASGTTIGSTGEFMTLGNGPSSPGVADSDRDGVPDADDLCNDRFATSDTQGKNGCPALYWMGANNFPATIKTTVENEGVEIFSRCEPALCTTRFTLTAGKRARKQLGLSKALLLRSTKTDRYYMFRGQRRIRSASFEWQPSGRVLKRLAKLDRLELKVRFEVSAEEQPEMNRARFTRSGTLVLDTRRQRSEDAPKGQGLRLLCGDQADDRLPDKGPCEN